MIQVYSEYYTRKYYASYFSVGSLCCLLSIVILVVLPFLLAFASPNFWNKVSFYHEQPLVSYKGIFIEADDTKEEPSTTVDYEDTNDDGVTDIITFDITVNKAKSITIALGISYELLDIGNTLMNATVFYSVSSANDICGVDAVGTLELRQRKPLVPSGEKNILYMDENIFEIVKEKGFAEGLEIQMLRNQTVKFKGNSIIEACAADATTQTITFRLKMYIPSQKVLYIPRMLETFKFAWMQYMSFFLPVYAIIYWWVLGVMYKNGAITAKVIEDPAMRKIEKRNKRY